LLLADRDLFDARVRIDREAEQVGELARPSVCLAVVEEDSVPARRPGRCSPPLS
jgi:hypothetical protein